jgi:hypothetical protein
MLAICLCFKDSAPYLDEWLRFHYVQGFRRFYLYNNESSDDWREVVRPWVDTGLVVPRDFDGKGVQTEMYNDCLAAARGQVDWLAFIDDDEFLYLTNGGSMVDALQPYRDTAGVAVSWILYGSGGADRQDSQWVIERFTQRSATVDTHVKCIVRPDRIERSEVVGHAFRALPGFRVVDERMRTMTEPQSDAPSASVLRLNHYLVKSWEEWRLRRSRPQVNTGLPTVHPEALWRTWDKEWSATTDTSALRYLDSMRAVAI